MSNVYLDWAASSPVNEIVLKTIEYFSQNYFYNPSSIYKEARICKLKLDEQRNRFAEIIGCKKISDIYFTSGGTEANNLAILSFLRKNPDSSIIYSEIEHPSVFESVKYMGKMGFKLQNLKIQKSGLIDYDNFESLLNNKTQLVCLMHVNNETGVIQDIEKVSRIIRIKEKEFNTKIHFHCDMVQSLGKLQFNIEKLDIDSASFSSHKLQGPKGVGALYFRNGLESISLGGGQENSGRSGTENLPGIAGFVKACEIACEEMEDKFNHIKTLNKILIDKIKLHNQINLIPEDRFSMPENFSPYITNISIPPVPGEILLRIMNDKGFIVSTGSACSSNKKKKARVLNAMGYGPELNQSSIRISFGPETSNKDLSSFISALEKELPMLYKLAGKQ